MREGEPTISTGVRASSWFGWALAGVALLGLAVRVTYILGWHWGYHFGGDQYFYHAGANLLADGKGFISPYSPPHHPYAASDHTPLYMLYLAIPSMFGFQSVLTHMLWSALLGTGTVVLVGLAGREIGGARLGIIAAAIAALNPNLWTSDGLLRVETMAMFTVALTLFLAYRYWHRPTWWRLAAVGAAGGAAALSRAELVLIIPFMVVPLALLAPGPTRHQRARSLVAGLVAALVLMSPWLVFNLTRFKQPELLTTSFGPTLSSTSCDEVWEGLNKSQFSIACSQAVATREAKAGYDQSELDAMYRRAAFRYIQHHKRQLPKVIAARVAAIMGLYHPAEQVKIDGLRGIGTFRPGTGRDFVEQKSEQPLAQAGMDSFYVMALLSVAGAVVLRRRRTVPLFPLLIPPAVVLITVVVTYAATRFRAPADVALCILAAITVDAAVNVARRRPRGRPREDAHDQTTAGTPQTSPTGS